MGESIVAASSYEDKMGGTATSDPLLEVSVSFGRFENDSLSWDKWSSFSQNKYLEEVEKCATPGSVAEKKAYFEAHYKRIAARKAELLDQEKQVEHNSLKESNQNNGDLMDKSGGTDTEFDMSNRRTTAEGIRQESKLDDEWDIDHADEPNDEDAVDAGPQASSNGMVVEEQASGLNSPVSSKAEEMHVSSKPEEVSQVTIVKEEETASQVMKELPKKEKEMESISIIKKEIVKLDHQKESPKITPMSKVRDLARSKKKPAPPVAKSTQISTLKVSKPVSTSLSLSASQPSTKKVNGLSLSTSKKAPAGENKKVAPKSLHISLSMDSPNSEPATLKTTTARKSLIMEKMGDKDIVKRAFKTFQNNFNQLKASAEETSFGAKQAPSKGTEVKVSTSVTPRKDSGGSLKSGGVDRRTAKPAPSSFGLNSDERAEKRKEFTKKLDEKSNAKQAESKQLRTKSKEEKESEISKLRQSLNFKGTPMPGFYRGQKASKTPLDNGRHISKSFSTLKNRNHIE